MSEALRGVKTEETPQSHSLLGRAMIQNDAGGYAFQVAGLERFMRFLILGTDGGTYYVGQREHTDRNVASVQDFITKNGPVAVDAIVTVSDAGRAPSNSPALFALAGATVWGDDETRALAFTNLSKVARTGTHLFEFANYRKNLGGGWGRGARKAVGGWYLRDADKLAYQLVKYRQRYGWTHRDVLRVAHPKTEDEALKRLFEWAVRGTHGELPAVVEGFIKAQEAANIDQLVDVLNSYNLPWEAVPTKFHNEAGLWHALIDNGSLPVGAMIRQLGRMAKLGVSRTPQIVGHITDHDVLRKARIHPMKVLIGTKAYKSGQGRSGQGWSPVSKIVDALDEAFYASFPNVEPAGKRTLVGLDVSGSMGWGYDVDAGGLTPRESTAAMALIQAKTEAEFGCVVFSTTTRLYDLSARRRLDDVIKDVSGLPFGGTDCAQPMIWAMDNKAEVDTFVVYTDNETWAGRIHPVQALNQYRQVSGIDARLVVAGVTATESSIADPNDPGMLDVVGFDATVPAVIADFSAGRLQ